MANRCPVCNVPNKKAHLSSCPKSKRFNGKVKPVSKKAQSGSGVIQPIQDLLTKKPVLEYIFLLDSSGSMGVHKRVALEAFNQQINALKQAAYENRDKQQIKVTVYEFNYSMKLMRDKAHPESIRLLTMEEYDPRNNTALKDAMGTVIEPLQTMPKDDVSTVVVVITDGEENASHLPCSDNLQRKILNAQATDHFSLVCLTPQNGKRILQSLGIPEGNIQIWNTLTDQGYIKMGEVLCRGITNYTTAHTKGLRSTQAFFVDASNIKTRDLTKLQDLSSSVASWQVDKEVAISDFVNERLAAAPTVAKQCGTSYKPGNAYYELTKREKVQAYKDLLILDRASKKIYGGQEAKNLLGLPANQDMRLVPGNYANYKFFIRSNSMNRKLVRGTTLLYKKF